MWRKTGPAHDPEQKSSLINGLAWVLLQDTHLFLLSCLIITDDKYISIIFHDTHSKINILPANRTASSLIGNNMIKHGQVNQQTFP